MDRKYLYVIGAVVISGALIATFVFWKYSHSPAKVPQVVEAPPPLPAPVPVPVPTPIPAPVIAAPPAPPPLPPLPPLAKSDSLVFDALAGLMGNESLMKLLYPKRAIHKIVATTVNLTQQRVHTNVMPLHPPVGHFLIVDADGQLSISPKNSNRYTSYVRIAGAVDAKKLVELYVRLYPLLQQSYQELGYRNKYFNDQLIETLDDLLETPEIKGPIKLLHPKYFYLYADPDLEELSIGQKIMLRLGITNVKLIKNKLNEIKQELALHTSELKVGKAN